MVALPPAPGEQETYFPSFYPSLTKDNRQDTVSSYMRVKYFHFLNKCSQPPVTVSPASDSRFRCHAIMVECKYAGGWKGGPQMCIMDGKMDKAERAIEDMANRDRAEEKEKLASGR